jgi:hypothetical protein
MSIKLYSTLTETFADTIPGPLRKWLVPDKLNLPFKITEVNPLITPPVSTSFAIYSEKTKHVIWLKEKFATIINFSTPTLSSFAYKNESHNEVNGKIEFYEIDAEKQNQKWQKLKKSTTLNYTGNITEYPIQTSKTEISSFFPGDGGLIEGVVRCTLNSGENIAQSTYFLIGGNYNMLVWVVHPNTNKNMKTTIVSMFGDYTMENKIGNNYYCETKKLGITVVNNIVEGPYYKLKIYSESNEKIIGPLSVTKINEDSRIVYAEVPSPCFAHFIYGKKLDTIPVRTNADVIENIPLNVVKYYRETGQYHYCCELQPSNFTDKCISVGIISNIYLASTKDIKFCPQIELETFKTEQPFMVIYRLNEENNPNFTVTNIKAEVDDNIVVLSIADKYIVQVANSAVPIHERYIKNTAEYISGKVDEYGNFSGTANNQQINVNVNRKIKFKGTISQPFSEWISVRKGMKETFKDVVRDFRKPIIIYTFILLLVSMIWIIIAKCFHTIVEYNGASYNTQNALQRCLMQCSNRYVN